MKVKKVKKQPEPEVQSDSDEEKQNSAEKSSGSDDSDDDADIPDPVNSNDDVINEMDAGESSDEDAPEEISSKVNPQEAIKTPQKPKEEKKEKEPAKLAYDKEDELKTVFCGNIPNASNVNETRIKDLFSQHGTVKSVRFRSESGKVLFSKKMKRDVKNFIAYVVFEKEEEAKSSIALNGYKLLSNVLRVNMANNKKEAFSSKGTIFVGNLPFDAPESEIYDYFSQVGEIEYVRKIANKGIAYVCFQKGVNLSHALKLNEKAFKGRNLRISRCESKEKQEKKKMFKKDDKTGKIVKQKVRKPHKMNEDAFVRGRSNNNPIIKKIKDTQKAKFNKFTDANQLSKKELFRRGGKMDQNQRDERREKTSKKQKFFGAKVDGIDKAKSKKAKVSKSIKEQKVIAKKLKSAAARGLGSKQ
jgi:nucleolar protein 12